MDIDDLEIGSKEWEDEVSRLQAIEDEEAGVPKVEAGEAEGEGGEGEGEQSPGTEQEPAGEGEEAAQTDPEKAAAPAVAGIASKDGKAVLPYAALQGARQQAKTERDARQAAEARATKAEQDLADLRAGKEPPAAKRELTDEEIADIREVNPAMADVIVAQREELAAAKVALAAKTPAPKGEAEAAKDESDPIQDAIDANPLLLQWQVSDPEKWAAADAFDATLYKSPKWGGMTPDKLAARYAHITQLVADQFDIEVPASLAPQSKEKGPSKADPKKAIEAATRTAPNSLSDFKGGGVDQTEQRLENMPAIKQFARVADMNEADFNAYLARI